MRPVPEEGAIDYYRIPFSALDGSQPMFYIENKLLPMDQNNMRVVMHAIFDGNESGMVEMQPVSEETDGSYIFEINMYPLNQLVDIDNRIKIASTDNGGGSWIPTHSGSVVSIDATNPELKISILVRTTDSLRDSEIEIGDTYTGFRIVDEYKLDDISLVQELKEMRSVVNFGESSMPTEEQMELYNNLMSLSEYDDTVDGNIASLTTYAYDRMLNMEVKVNGRVVTFSSIKSITKTMYKKITEYLDKYTKIIPTASQQTFKIVADTLYEIMSDGTSNGDSINWENVWSVLGAYNKYITEAFKGVNVNGGMEIQLMPFISSSLMTSDRFASFVSCFTQVHKAIEPVIMHRLEGNNYLDCKLIATYGLPHSYSSDVDYELENVYWPDLNVQIEFDVKLYNSSLATNTINELRLIVKSYFNRLTSIHTPVDLISMDNNIYISHVIQQMEAHDNVAYMKFKGWYTDEKNDANGRYMDANIQAIVMKHDKLDDFDKEELERFTPEMFILDDENIVINLIK
jgi:hypothetical protein